MPRSKSCSRPLWPLSITEEPLFSSFADALATSPSLEPATFGEVNSCSMDIPALPHNAVRQELSDMISMYRAMADLGSALSFLDVKASTLWFRTFSKFLGQYVFTWHKENLFPWFSETVQLEPIRRIDMTRLLNEREDVASLAKTVYGKHARLSAEVSGQAREDLARVQFVDAVIGAVRLAQRLVEYFRSVESFIAPLLLGAGVTPEDRDEQFSKIVQQMLDNGTVRIDLPMLVRWMPRSVLKEWLLRCAVDHRGRAISVSSFNRWQRDYFGDVHLKIVQGLHQKAKSL